MQGPGTLLCADSMVDWTAGLSEAFVLGKAEKTLGGTVTS